jgi:mRNA-degrading endonuclease RelE of RelBE toxin-antitoxin system
MEIDTKSPAKLPKQTRDIFVENEKVKRVGYEGKLRITDGVDHGLRVLQKDFRFTYKRDEDTKIITIY